MSLDSEEMELIYKLQETEDPFSVSDLELDLISEAIKRERGNADKQLRRDVRNHIAETEKWKFALDGGFMHRDLGGPHTTGKEWPDGKNMFGKVYGRYENLAISLTRKGYSLDEIEKMASDPYSKVLL